MSNQPPLENRVKNVEEAVQLLTTLAISANERMEQHGAWINQLGDAQARVETDLSALTQIVSELGQSQTRVENNLDALTQIVSDLGQAQARTEQALEKLAAAQEKLAESQEHTDRRLDALIDIVRRNTGRSE